MKQPGNERVNPRTSRVRKVILDSAVDLFVNQGAAAVTATRIAEETGVARTTIYRQWPDQPSLVLATIEAMVAPHFEAAATGDTQADLATALANLRTRLSRNAVHPVIAALIDYASRDKAFVAAQRTFVEALVAEVSVVLGHAQDRGELPPSFDCSNGATLIAGPVLHQHLLLRKKISDELIDEIVEQFSQHHLTR